MTPFAYVYAYVCATLDKAARTPRAFRTLCEIAHAACVVHPLDISPYALILSCLGIRLRHVVLHLTDGPLVALGLTACLTGCPAHDLTSVRAVCQRLMIVTSPCRE